MEPEKENVTVSKPLWGCGVSPVSKGLPSNNMAHYSRVTKMETYDQA